MIQVHHNDEQDLRWWADDEYDAMKQPRSQGGALISFAELGCKVQERTKPNEVGDRHFVARDRLDRIQEKLRKCTPADIYLLRNAFQTADCRGLLTYGPYPRAVVGLREAELACEAAGRPLSQLLPFLRELANRATAKDAQVGDAARAQVRKLRDSAERALAVALSRYGARVTSDRSTPNSVGLKALARSMRSHPDTVRTRLTTLSIPVSKAGDGRSWSIAVSDLRDRWPEAAARLTEESRRDA